MPIRFQLVIDCADPDRLARFWAAALGYELAPPPAGFPTWDDYYRDLGVPEEELGVGEDRISDPQGHGPDIWFQVVPEAKAVKNRLHLDILASGERTDPFETRRQRVDAEASRLAGLGATIARVLYQEGLDHYGVAMKDRRVTSSISADLGRASSGCLVIFRDRELSAFCSTASDRLVASRRRLGAARRMALAVAAGAYRG